MTLQTHSNIADRSPLSSAITHGMPRHDGTRYSNAGWGGGKWEEGSEGGREDREGEEVEKKGGVGEGIVHVTYTLPLTHSYTACQLHNVHCTYAVCMYTVWLLCVCTLYGCCVYIHCMYAVCMYTVCRLCVCTLYVGCVYVHCM